MSELNKDAYVLASLRRIGRNKKWEVYVITKMIHLLNDNNLEFACQQCVKVKGSDKFYLTDLCFPSLGLYIEVNEKGHSGKNKKIKDRERQEAIQNSTSWKQLDIDTYEYDDDKKKVDRTIEDINKTIEDIVEEIKIVIPAHIIGLQKLQKLKQDELWQAGKVKMYHSAISEIIREYIEKRYEVHALENTTHEIMQSLRFHSIEPNLLTKLNQVLVLSDLVKFAKEKPLAAENEMSLMNAVGFVKGTKQIIAPTEENAE